MPVRVLGYGRVSTSRQVISPEVQRQQCRDWFDRNVASGDLPADAKWEGIWIDEAVSGKVDLFHRPKGQHIPSTLSAGDVLVVAKDSRAFRSPGDAERSIDAFKKMGVRLVILNLNVDTATPSGMLMITIFAAFARFERELISERTSEALQLRIRQGQWLGHPPPGWKVRKKSETKKMNGELVPDERTRWIGHWCAHQISRGMLTERIAFLLGKHLPTGLIPRYSAPPGQKGWYTPLFVLKWAAYYVCEWPPLTSKKFKEMLGCDPYNRDFILDRYLGTEPDPEVMRDADKSLTNWAGASDNSTVTGPPD